MDRMGDKPIQPIIQAVTTEIIENSITDHFLK